MPANEPWRTIHFGDSDWVRVEKLLREEWSPEQVAGYLGGHGELTISHETIYRHVWRDLQRGVSLRLHLRWAQKQCRKRYGRNDGRGDWQEKR